MAAKTSKVERTTIAGSIEIPRILNGLWQLAGGHDQDVDVAAAARAMTPLIDAGLDAFDMADHYGPAELVLGEHTRTTDRPVTAFTKWCPPETGDKSLATAEAAVDRALARMGAAQIALMQYHVWDYTDDTYLVNLAHLRTLQARGKIAHVGLTNVDTAHLEMLLDSGYEVVSNQVAGGWEAFQGVLGAVAGVAKKHGVSVAAVAMRWVLDVPAVKAVIIGARLSEQSWEYAEKNVEAFGFKLDEEDRAAIAKAQEGLKDIPGDCGDEYRRPPFMTASGDLSDHIKESNEMQEVEEAIAMGKRVEFHSGSKWEPICGYSRAVRFGNVIRVSGTTANPPQELQGQLGVVGGKSAKSQAVAALDIIERAFRPLEEPDAIRLLVLHPSHEATAPLSGSLINTTLSACDSDFANGYLALSYVWGKPASTSSIQIDGIDVRITDNLVEALTQVRNAYLGTPQRIWADALCINQSDTAEKNRQVPLMGNIYSLAKITIIYLGPLSPGIETIFKAVHDSKPGFVTVDPAGDSRIALAKDLQHLKKFDLKGGSEPPAAAIDELLQRPWFTRVWVTQELLLSRDAWVQCGALRVRWRELGALLVPILDRTRGKGSTALQQMQSLNLEEEKKDIKDRERANYLRKVGKPSEELIPSLSYILRMRQGCRASDPRDMIFAYMGMHADRDEVAEFFTVDYEMPLRQLLISTARYILHRDGPEVLLHCVKHPPTNNWLNLPSWVPHWGIHEWSQATSNTNATTSEDESLFCPVEKGKIAFSPEDERITTYSPLRDPKFIRYVSPILPRPQEVPQCVVDLVKRAASVLGKYEETAWEEFLEAENLSFWRDLDIRSSETQDPSPIRLFPDSFWDLAAEDEREYPRLKYMGIEAPSQKAKVATRALQTLSFFMAYVGREVMSARVYDDEDDNALQWNLHEGQRIRLALSTAGFILAVPAYVEVGDVFMRLDSLTAKYGSTEENHCFGGLLRPIAKDTGDPLIRAFKWLCFGGVPVWKEVYGSQWKFMLPTEVDNIGLKWYKDRYPDEPGKLKYIELC
ncbi:hypothetical protein K4K59_000167 [Colletotrichum sp. SAR11_240]|nr:hypothetical protein K4K59_000167 [Colletotrichum sp. SAR11_240]